MKRIDKIRRRNLEAHVATALRHLPDKEFLACVAGIMEIVHRRVDFNDRGLSVAVANEAIQKALGALHEEGGG